MSQHPIFKLGKQKPSRDYRNLRLKTILQPKITLPAEYSLMAQYPDVRPGMFGNDTYGDCVMACRANQTLYFERIEQKKTIKITDKEVENEYFKETGGSDSGLVMTESLNSWRAGWKAAGANYKIKVYAEANRKKLTEVLTGVVANCGVQLGIELPLSAQTEINAGKPWAITTGKGSTPGSWGGHCVLLMGYDSKYLYVITWGQKQALTRAWFAKYCSEAYTVIDALDSVKKKFFDESGIDSFISTL